MKRFALIALTVVCVTSGYAQAPDTIYISANNPAPVFSKYVLKSGTKYVVQAMGRVSYWRDVAPAPDTPDADAGFVFHVPYVSYVSNKDVDSCNSTIGQFQYLPADGSSCSTVPVEFGCGTITNSHSPNIYKVSELHLDKDYLEFNGTEFCPRNGGDHSRNTYWQGLMGNDQLAEFRFNDGDGDYVHNWGRLMITITRLEPIMHVSTDSLVFGKMRPNSATPKTLVDSVYNLGSPFFPGCTAASANLRFTVDSITGDMGNDGFQVTGVTVGRLVDIQQGYAAEFKATFTPRQKRVYRAIMWLTTTDPQTPHMKVYLTGEGIQGLARYNPVDTLDFGDTPLNQFRTLPLSIQNVGTDYLHLQAISPNVVDPAFTIPNQGKMDMQIGVGIKPMFKFAPNRLGLFYGSVIVSSDSYGESQHMVYLKGRGVAALLVVDSVLDFGSWPVGDSTIQSLPLRNAGNIPFGVQFVQFSAGDSLDFSAEPRTHITIEPDSILNWKMGFHPQKPGRRTAVAEIAADGGGAPHYVYVIGNGIVVSKIATSPRLDYGVVSIDTTKTMSVVVRNVGNVPISLQQVSLASGANWSLPRTTFPTLRPKDSLLIDAIFAPTMELPYSDTMHLVDDSLRTYDIPLTGNGKRFVGILSVADTLDFGEVFVGDTITKYLPFRNVGNARLVLSNMGFPVPVSEFSAMPTLPVRIDTAMVDSTQAFFHPTTLGIKTATFEIRDSLAGRNDGVQHIRDVVFLGKATPPIIAVLAVDSVYTADVGMTVTIPVELRADISKAQSTYFKTDLRFDPTVLLPLSISSAPITADYTVTMNEVKPGTLTLEGNGPTPLLGTGNICYITFEVLASVNKQTPLVIQTPKVGNGRNPRSVQTIDGRFAVAGQCGSTLTTQAMATHLADNAPNPFGAATSVHYVVGLPTHVTISVYDAVGRKVADLVDEDKKAGSYSAQFNPMALTNGLYYCRMTAGQFVGTKTMMLIK